MGIIATIKNIPYEKRVIASATISTILGTMIALGKIIVGSMVDIVLVAVGIFNILLGITKTTCIIGARKNKPYGRRNRFSACFLFLAGLLYATYMAVSLIFDMEKIEYALWMSIILALIAFVELGFAINGLVRARNKGHYFRNIKIVSLVSALTAMMTAQVALLSFRDPITLDINVFTGIFIGVVTMLLAVYVFFAPQISVFDREHNVFRLVKAKENVVADMSVPQSDIMLIRNKIHGNFIFSVKVDGDILDGHIKKTHGFWRDLPTWAKVLFIIFSEILIFPWIISWFIFFFRTMNMPVRLKKMMERNGFELVEADEEMDASKEVERLIIKGV